MTTPVSARPTAQVRIGNGRVLLDQSLVAQHLAGASAAALVERDGQVYLLPLTGPGGGGLLLKQCNARGDRVLLAADFLAARGLGHFSAEQLFAVRWVAEAGALAIDGLPAAADPVGMPRPD